MDNEIFVLYKTPEKESYILCNFLWNRCHKNIDGKTKWSYNTSMEPIPQYRKEEKKNYGLCKDC